MSGSFHLPSFPPTSTEWTPAFAGVTDHSLQCYRSLKFFRYSATDRVISALKSDMYLRLQSASMVSLSPRSLCIPRKLIRFHFPVAVLMDDMVPAKAYRLLAIKLLFRGIPID